MWDLDVDKMQVKKGDPGGMRAELLVQAESSPKFCVEADDYRNLVA